MEQEKNIVTGKRKLLGMTLGALKEAVQEAGMPSFTAKQIADWIYCKRVDSIEEMSNISLKNREKLSELFEVGFKTPADAMRSVDGTIKYLYEVDNGHFVEAVYIPDGERATLCVSSQVGCKMNCLFCMTGKQKYTANLTANEILNQILALPEFERLTNIVFMGMGEPCDNLDNLLPAIEVLTSPYGLGWSPHRITVSTVGVRKGLKRLLDAGDFHIAVSLHHPIPEKRMEIMPAEKGFSILEMLDILRGYDFSHQRRLTFEYIVFKDTNETLQHARKLLKLLEGMDCRINLIRYHAIPGVPLEGVNEEGMVQLRDYLTKNGLFTTIRASRGEDIFAACGMLSTLKQNNNKKDI
ncbi:MAG: 23S rRNA (adenine(2503)-C(2))-methyltransferase RlmN [Bacteroidaceae bacterium]|nr:23S rRNA (adenine(2503)-C(2))-methyltransferase RlmN [Bacteroidaceae bacterium]